MRDTNFNRVLFLEQLEIFFSKHSQKTLELRAQVVDNPNFLAENYLVLPYDLKSLLALSFASWWLPEEIGWIIREDIRDKRLPKLSLEDKTLLEVFLSNKATMVSFLDETTLWHTRDFFGNFLQLVLKRIVDLRFRRIRTKVKTPQRKRGYHDHGTLVPSSKWTPKEDYTLTEQQLEIYEKRKTQEDTLAFIFGFLE